MSNVGSFQERKVEVAGHPINYVQVGDGPNPVLLLSGALGTWMDVEPQLKELNVSNRLTLLAKGFFGADDWHR